MRRRAARCRSSLAAAAPFAGPGARPAPAAPDLRDRDRGHQPERVGHRRRGRYVTDLTQKDFAVFEDGIRQELSLFTHENLPISHGAA